MVLQSISIVLTWPVVVLVLALIYKRSITESVSRLTHYRGFGQELDFGQRLAELESAEAVRPPGEPSQTAQEVPGAKPGGVSPEQAGTPPKTERDRARLDLAETEPSFLVLSSWQDLAEAIEDLANALAPAAPRKRRSPTESLKVLQQNEMIRPLEVEELLELQDLRNRVAHGQHRPTPGEALTYANLALSVRSRVYSVARHPSKSGIWKSVGAGRDL